MTAVAALLEARLGFALDAVGGLQALGSRCAARAATLGVPPDDYVALLLDRGGEIDALVETLVVPETWFHRDGAPFRTVAARVAEAHRRHPATPVRVLCVPCSTGEEAYSIAMACFDAGLPEGAFTIEARDVSRAALERARVGRYVAWSFRSDARRGREHWFQPVDGGWEVVDALRRPIDWAQANVMDAAFLAGAGRYHAIFCRNLLIYLTPAARAQVVDRLLGHLADDGVIVAGHAENLAAVDGRLGLVPGNAFVWHRAGPRAPLSRTPRRGAPTAPAEPPRRPAAARAPLPQPPPPPRATPPPPLPLLEQAAALADAGRLTEAQALCAEQLRAQPTDADACHLAGTLASAGGDVEAAERWFKRAVYLAPRHYRALAQLALLCEQRGDRVAAGNYRRRAAASLGEGTKP